MLEPFEFDASTGLRCGPIPVEQLAEEHGTPLYVYAADGITGRYDSLAGAFAQLSPSIHFAAKSCSTIEVLRVLIGRGAGIDVVSGGELERAWLAGCSMDRIVFAGVGKSSQEIAAALDGSRSPLAGSDIPAQFGAPPPETRGPVGLFNIESEQELARLDRIARELGVHARGALRINPDVDAKTHEYTTTGKGENKFGIAIPDAEKMYRAHASPSDGEPGLRLVGLHCHIGSPVPEVEPYALAIEQQLALANRLREAGREVSVINIGGGWSTPYTSDENRPVERYSEALVPLLTEEVRSGTRILMEPGRSLIANAGILVTRVEYLKRAAKRFLICDAGMHLLLRPALYKAFHFAWPVHGPAPAVIGPNPGIEQTERTDLVGPICESGDFLAKDRQLPTGIEQGDLVALFSAGAYGMSMGSNYNDHPKPAEVLVEGSSSRLIRQRQSPLDLLRDELPGTLRA